MEHVSDEQHVSDVCYGSKADIGLPAIDVRYSPKSGHWN
jgi:hypothetical protein